MFTLAQDAKILINKYGYEIGNVFMLDMFLRQFILRVLWYLKNNSLILSL